MKTRKKKHYLQLAHHARETCILSKVIDKDIMKLDCDTLEKIIQFFGGRLIKGSVSYFKKKNDDEFEICLGEDVNTDERSITVLKGLGCAFAIFYRLKIYTPIRLKDEYFITDFPYPQELLGVYLFSKEFLMPENLYNQSLLKNKDNYEEVAQDFDTGYELVLSRRNDLVNIVHSSF